MKKNITITYDHLSSIDELTNEEQQLIQSATTSVQNAYAPYSKFKVGAAVLLDNGEIIIGNNQENIAYPSGLCAERVALFAAKAKYPSANVLKIAIASDGDLLNKDDFLTPCGACRQVMAEVTKRQDNHFDIILMNNDKTILVFHRINDLLPFVFGNSNQ